MARIGFGEWTPDSPSLAASALEALNVYPRTTSSYGAFPSLSAYSNALGAYCRGGFSGRKASDGTSHTFAGDASKLYSLSSVTFSDISVSGGYSLGVYDAWEFVKFGDLVIAVAGGENIQSYNLATLPATFTALSATAPQAKHIGAVKDFIMVGNTYDTTFGDKPTRVWWPAINDPTTWPTVGTQAAYNVQSDYQDLPTGEYVTSIQGAVGGVDGVIFCATAIHTAVYGGAPNIFSFREADNSRGTVVSGSVAHAGKFIVFLAEDGFYAFDGASSSPIGSGRVDKWFYSKFAQSYGHRVTSIIDPINKLYIISFPDGEAGQTPNNLLIWNWVLNRWSHAQLTQEMIFKSLSSDLTLEGLDAISGSIDTLPESLDSRAYIGGKLLLSAFDTDHKLSYFTGPNLAATITTKEFGDENGQRMFVSGIRPILEGSASPTISLSVRNDQSESVTETAATSKGADGICPQRISCRYARANMSIPAADTWTHAVGIEPTFKAEGKR